MPPRVPISNGPMGVPVIPGPVPFGAPPTMSAAFPAYGEPATSSGPADSERLGEVPNQIQKLGAKIHIMHPDEDISLVCYSPINSVFICYHSSELDHELK